MSRDVSSVRRNDGSVASRIDRNELFSHPLAEKDVARSSAGDADRKLHQPGRVVQRGETSMVNEDAVPENAPDCREKDGID